VLPSVIGSGFAGNVFAIYHYILYFLAEVILPVLMLLVLGMAIEQNLLFGIPLIEGSVRYWTLSVVVLNQ
jgi:hypothetical protein